MAEYPAPDRARGRMARYLTQSPFKVSRRTVAPDESAPNTYPEGAMAGAGKAAPECTNGHGPMSLAADQEGRPIPVEPGVDHGSVFVAYGCSVCSYREFHDSTV